MWGDKSDAGCVGLCRRINETQAVCRYMRGDK